MNHETKINILIVDDRPENLISLENLLKEDDVVIYKAQSGVEALELLLKHGFALALLDVQMPEMNGFELAELMRGKEKTKTIPIIFVTAGAIDAQHTFMGYDAGAVDFLYKPLDTRIVKSKVKVFKELEQQKLVIQDQLTQLSQALKWRDDFLSIASHELKTPITSMRLQTQMAARSLQKSGSKDISPEKLEKYFMTSNKQLDKLTRLIDDLLDTTRIRAGKLTVDPIEVNFSQLMTDILERYEDQLAEANCHIESEIQKNIMVYCDPFRAEQVIVNLLSNAMKYAQGKPVAIKLRQEHGQAFLTIQDAGPGIAPEKLDAIFERFKRGNKHEGISGLGLGLYIAKQVMDAHHGSITVKSTPGLGSAFTINFPNTLAATL
ncbi:hybrid sensor histidine kinase/response regulator [Bacteriovorax sp. PP10]|uniref:histidine kinase n=1 Tax=Bacteriovorax antarcticus TaxID=3088717 RepID=A0ABU5VT10_9BACT|nr:hybrid sensor histidine kinase/response regulator [Bacteriovorax sp. PP10]MEA9356194.1 hybrid sensor histidine kinase/response regulator [Bacteriovorax sp. PP10]